MALGKVAMSRGCDGHGGTVRGISGFQGCCILEIDQGNQYLLVLEREKGLVLS